MANISLSPGTRPDQTLSLNMKLLGHHELDGFGGIGEGCNMQKTKDGRRILWLAHESAPKNFTGVDVTDPLNPKVVVQTDLPHARVRSNSLDVVGDIMAVAYQTQKVNQQPAEISELRGRAICAIHPRAAPAFHRNFPAQNQQSVACLNALLRQRSQDFLSISDVEDALDHSFLCAGSNHIRRCPFSQKE